MATKNTIKFSLIIISVLFITVFISGCSHSDDDDAKTQAEACTKKGYHQADCIYKEALAAADIQMCDQIDVDVLSMDEKSSEHKAYIPVIKDKCIFEVSIKTKNRDRCTDLADSKYQYNSDRCFFEIAQATNNLQLCLLVTPAGRVNPETNYIFNQANCILKLKATLLSVGCGKGADSDLNCVVSLGATKNSPDVCDEYFNIEQDEETNLVCTGFVLDLERNIEKAAISAWAKK